MINIPSQQSDLVPNITSISGALKENWFVKLNFPVKLLTFLQLHTLKHK